MHTILGLILVALFAYLGSALFRLQRLPIALRALISSGLGFFAIGLVLGPLGVDLLGPEVLSGLDVLINLGLGWVGLLFGLQFRFGELRRLPLRHYLAAMLEAGLTLAVCAGPLLAVLVAVGPDAAPPLVVTGVLAAAASTSSPTAMALVQQQTAPRGPVAGLLRLFNAVDAVPAILVVGVVLCFAPVHPLRHGPWLDGLFWLAVACGLGLALGAMFHLFTLYRYDETQLLVVVLGLVVFCGGAAHFLVLSPLFVNFLVGLVVANRSPQRQHILRSLVQVEKPIYLILLTLAGAMWNAPAGVYWLLAVGYALCRLLGKWLAGFGAAPVAGVRAPGPLGLGAGLFDHGGMALAIALGFSQFFVGPVFDLTLTAVVLSMLLTTLISPWSLRRTLQRAGEVP